jgi:hypothetical protein
VWVMGLAFLAEEGVRGFAFGLVDAHETVGERLAAVDVADFGYLGS